MDEAHSAVLPIRVVVLYARPMTTQPEAAAHEPSTARQRDLVALLIALVVAVVLARIVSTLTLRGAIPTPVLQVLVGDLSVGCRSRSVPCGCSRGRAGHAARFRIELGDLVFALGIVILARVLDVVLAISFTGTTGLTPAPSLGAPDVGFLVVSAIGIVLVSPVLEELFFRGLFQRILADELTPRTQWLAVVLTAFLFALSHLFLGSATTTLGGFQVFVTTFVLGLLTGTLVAMTNGSARRVVAHVLFNAVAVVATWPGSGSGARGRAGRRRRAGRDSAWRTRLGREHASLVRQRETRHRTAPRRAGWAAPAPRGSAQGRNASAIGASAARRSRRRPARASRPSAGRGRRRRRPRGRRRRHGPPGRATRSTRSCAVSIPARSSGSSPSSTRANCLIVNARFAARGASDTTAARCDRSAVSTRSADAAICSVR